MNTRSLQARNSLLLRHAQLLSRHQRERELGLPPADLASADVLDAASAAEADLLQGHLEDAHLRELRDIYVALRRITQGEWGVCSVCHQAISAARLRAIPEARRCVTCAGGQL